MSLDDTRQEAWRAMQVERGRIRPDRLEPELPLQQGGGGDTLPPMEARVAKLEAHMEQVRTELGKLAFLPADVATIKERLSHLPTKAEVKSDLDVALDRMGTRVQRYIAVVGGLIGIVGVATTVMAKIL